MNADFSTSTKPFTVAGLPRRAGDEDDDDDHGDDGHHGHGDNGDDDD